MAKRTCKRPTPRLSLIDAFRLLLKAYLPHVARELLDAALRDNRVRLYRDGIVVDPIELRDCGFYVRCAQAPDNRWTCSLASNAPQRVLVDHVYEDEDGTAHVVIVPPAQPVWEVKRNDLEALVGRADGPPDSPDSPGELPRRKPGPPPRDDWPTVVTRELIRIIRLGENPPTPARMQQFCVDTLGREPDLRAMQRLFRTLGI
jgi:hypothetical protein